MPATLLSEASVEPAAMYATGMTVIGIATAQIATSGALVRFDVCVNTFGSRPSCPNDSSIREPAVRQASAQANIEQVMPIAMKWPSSPRPTTPASCGSGAVALPKPASPNP